MVRQVTIQARKGNGTANKHTAMGFQRGVPATQPGVWVPQIVRSLEEAGVFTTRLSVSLLRNGQPPYTNSVGQG